MSDGSTADDPGPIDRLKSALPGGSAPPEGEESTGPGLLDRAKAAIPRPNRVHAGRALAAGACAAPFALSGVGSVFVAGAAVFGAEAHDMYTEAGTIGALDPSFDANLGKTLLAGVGAGAGAALGPGLAAGAVAGWAAGKGIEEVPRHRERVSDRLDAAGLDSSDRNEDPSERGQTGEVESLGREASRDAAESVRTEASRDRAKHRGRGTSERTGRSRRGR